MQTRRVIGLFAIVFIVMFSALAFGDENDDSSATIVEEGSCGESATWSYDNETKALTISGIGKMKDYSANSSPWNKYKDEIESVGISGVTSIGNYAFYGCTALTYVGIPTSVITIGNYAFCACISMESIEIPSSVTSIGNSAFEECESLGSIEIPSSVTSIGIKAFAECTSLTSFITTADLASFSVGMFYNCKSLISVTIPSTVTLIDRMAFQYCNSLMSIEIPALLTSIADNAFMYCNSVKNFNVSNDNPGFSSTDGVLFNKDGTKLVQYAFGKGGEYAIPSTVTAIDKNAFRYCHSLTSITIPSSVTSIPSNAFVECTALISITIPSSVTTIGTNAFALGTSTDPVICTVYTDAEGMLDTYGNTYTTFNYVNDEPGSYTVNFQLVNAPSDVTVLESQQKNIGDTVSIQVVPVDGYNIYVTVNDTPTSETSFIMPSKDVTVVITYVKVYTLTFINEGKEYETIKVEHGSAPECPDTDPVKQSDVGKEYDFAEWGGFSDVTTVTSDMEFTAVFSETVRKYTATFNGYALPLGFSIGYGQEIEVPITDPVKASTSIMKYEFVGWNGFTEGMRIYGDITFEPMFRSTVDVSADDLDGIIENDKIKIDDDSDEVRISADAVGAMESEISSTDTTTDGLSISTSNGTIELDGTAVSSLKGEMTADVTVSISSVMTSTLSPAIQDIVKDRPVYDVSIGDISSFNGGILKISLKYSLKADEDASNIVIWCVKTDGTIERFVCTYADGYVTFETTHLSYYCIGYESQSIIDDGGDGKEDNGNNDGDGLPITYIIGAAIAAIAVILVAVFVLRKS